MKYNNQTLGTLALLFAGVFLSFGGTLIQYMDSATAIEITTFRSITFSLIMLLYILVKFKRKTPQAFKAIGKS